jgi:hypothetical protein
LKVIALFDVGPFGLVTSRIAARIVTRPTSLNVVKEFFDLTNVMTSEWIELRRR